MLLVDEADKREIMLELPVLLLLATLLFSSVCLRIDRCDLKSSRSRPVFSPPTCGELFSLCIAISLPAAKRLLAILRPLKSAACAPPLE